MAAAALMIGAIGGPACSPSGVAPAEEAEATDERPRPESDRSEPSTSQAGEPWLGSSNLPVMLIDTRGEKLGRTTEHRAWLEVFEPRNGQTALGGSPALATEIRVGYRGQTSRSYPKKGLAVELWLEGATGPEDHKAEFLSLPAEEDWVLHGPYSDKSLMRNAVALTLASEMSSRYVPRHRFVELFLSRRGKNPLGKSSYHGVYLLVEKIKRGPDRVNLTRDGFLLEITKAKKVGPRDFAFAIHDDRRMLVKYPRSLDIKDGQLEFLTGYIEAFEDALFGDAFEDENLGYRKYIVLDSFVDHMLMMELFKNRDAFSTSTFVQLEPGERLVAGPVWDFNVSSGNDNQRDKGETHGWHVKGKSHWGGRLLTSEVFRQRMEQRWRALRTGPFADDALRDVVTSYQNDLREAQVRNFKRWPVLGRYVWPNKKPYATSFEDAVGRLSGWLVERAKWIDENFPQL